MNAFLNSVLPGSSIATVATSAMTLGGQIIDKIWPDEHKNAAERDKAKLALMELQQSGQLELLQVQMSAILAEAQAADPWTARARPSFLYVMYVMILAAIPMGFVSAYNPDLAVKIANGMASWLNAIPDSLWALFGVGYLGYVGAKSFDNRKLPPAGRAK